MAKREEKGGAGSFARGAELWMHQARLFVVAIWTVVLISILAGLGVTTAYFWNATTADEKYALERNVLAHTRDALYMLEPKNRSASVSIPSYETILTLNSSPRTSGRGSAEVPSSTRAACMPGTAAATSCMAWTWPCRAGS